MNVFYSLLLIAHIAQGEILPDPTRPVFEIATGSAAMTSSTTLLELQSVFIAPERRWAIINGQTLVVGDTIGEARLVGIASDAVTLVRGQALEILKIFPYIHDR